VEDKGSKLIQKARQASFIPAGRAGFWNSSFYKMGNTKMSVHLIHMHVDGHAWQPQGFVVGAMTLGIGYSMYQEFWAKPKP
ncbi:hypothetical protein FD754_022605, partial [Muntiacus muntjak]